MTNGRENRKPWQQKRQQRRRTQRRRSTSSSSLTGGAQASPFFLRCTADPPTHSFVHPQLFPSRLRQQEYGQDHDQVGDYGEYGDGVSEGNTRAEVANRSRKQCADGASIIVGKSLARAAQPAGKQFGKECAHRTERPRREEAERKSQHQHQRVADGQKSVR